MHFANTYCELPSSGTVKAAEPDSSDRIARDNKDRLMKSKRVCVKAVVLVVLSAVAVLYESLSRVTGREQTTRSVRFGK